MNHPPSVGMALWLLEGGGLVERVAWLARNGFGGVSLLQSVMDADRRERQEAAAAIVDEGLWVTYHGNVNHKLSADGELNMEFAARLKDDVLWWHENTCGVSCCCCDPIHVSRPDGAKHFDFDMNRRHLRFMHSCLSPHDIPIGIENSYGGEGLFCSLADIAQFKTMCPNTPMGMLLDVGHANIHVRSDANSREHNGDVAGYVRQLPHEFLEVHLSDNKGAEDDHMYLGWGNLDLPDLFGVLKERNFRGRLTVEVCYDRLGGKAAADIREPAETDGLLTSRDKILSAWASV